MMSVGHEKERLRYSIDRFDHYYDSVNNKSNVFLTLSAFIFGALVAFYPTVLETVECDIWVHSLMAAPLILGIIIMIVVVRASRPYLSKEKNSLIFFHSISRMEKNEFFKLSADEDEAGELEDLRIQAYQLAQGLSRKFAKLRTVGILFTLQFILFIPLTYLIISNIKK